MAIAGSVELLVMPELLVQKADEVQKKVIDMKNCFDRMKTLVDRSKSYWVGEAGDQHRKNYSEQQQNISDMLRRWDEHPRDLNAIAQTYLTTEKNIQQVIVQELPGDLL
ncbi:WXG100 family type VII secretion target [Brotaphodocola sp.]|uniref:WXG100 family type VII secretion target n=1 Tax=Brotaphodocola sp. TaxID=3073577 RepID=UPI003D7D0473